jgi:hypothetical protein
MDRPLRALGVMAAVPLTAAKGKDVVGAEARWMRYDPPAWTEMPKVPVVWVVVTVAPETASMSAAAASADGVSTYVLVA